MEICAVQSLSTDAIARTLGVSKELVERWERGEEAMTLTPPQMLYLCQCLNISLEDLALLYREWGPLYNQVGPGMP